MSVPRGMTVIPFLFSLLLIGCAPKASDVIVLEVGPSKFTLGDYEKFYLRNSGGLDAARKSTQADREHFLDLLANYKLKLLDAYDHHLLQDTEIVRELKEYRATLASTYLIEKEITDPGIRTLYDRRKEEIRAQHILLRLSPDAAPADTFKVYQRAMDIIRRAHAGENFDSLALKYSEDPTVKMNHGDIYYFTGGQMVTPFENAAYQMKPGEVSSVPTRTAFGYHIIRILDREPSRGTIKVSHIMMRFQKSAADSADTAAALSRVKAMQDSLRRGWDFHQLASKFSEDAGSAPKGGDLGWFERRRFVQPFDEAAFKLRPGQVSGIVRTPFGYHLILCDSARPFPSYEALHDELKKSYQQQRYAEDYAAYIAGLKKEFSYSFSDSTFDAFLASLDSTKNTDDSAWTDKIPPELRQRALMSMNHHPVSLDTVVDILQRGSDYRGIPLRRSELKTPVDRIGESLLIQEKSAGLEERNPDFASLMKEYTDGIVLYKAEQTEVWNRTAVTDSALKEYYSQNKTKFRFPERVNIAVIEPGPDTLAYLVYDSLKHGASFAELAQRYPEERDTRSEDGSRGFQPVDTDPLTKHAETMSVGEISEPFEAESGVYAIIKLIAREPAREKTFEEAGAEISNAYQEASSKLLETRWLESIKQRYPVKEYPEALQKAFQSPEPSQ